MKEAWLLQLKGSWQQAVLDVLSLRYGAGARSSMPALTWLLLASGSQKSTLKVPDNNLAPQDVSEASGRFPCASPAQIQASTRMFSRK